MATETSGPASEAAQDAADEARRATETRTFRWLARLGLASRAAIYLVLGTLVLLLAVGHPAAPTDQRGALQELADHEGGFVLVAVLAAGFACYAVWRGAEAAFGVVAQGRGAGARWQALGGALTYVGLTVSAVSVLLSEGHSSANAEQSWSARLMGYTGGRWLVGAIGVVVVAMGVWQIRDGVTRGFAKFFDRARMQERSWRTAIVLGTVGSISRGIVFGLTGIFVIVAAVTFDPHEARGLDGSLRHLRDSPAGPFVLVLIAIGLVLFGLFGLCEVRWRRTGTADQSRSSVA